MCAYGEAMPGVDGSCEDMVKEARMSVKRRHHECTACETKKERRWRSSYEFAGGVTNLGDV